jgi:hypothetical protein
VFTAPAVSADSTRPHGRTAVWGSPGRSRQLVIANAGTAPPAHARMRKACSPRSATAPAVQIRGRSRLRPPTAWIVRFRQGCQDLRKAW